MHTQMRLQDSVIAAKRGRFPEQECFSLWSNELAATFVQKKHSEMTHTSFPKASRPSHHVPRSHRFQTHFSQSITRQRSWSWMRTANDRPLGNSSTVVTDPQVIDKRRTGLAISQQSTSLQHCKQRRCIARLYTKQSTTELCTIDIQLDFQASTSWNWAGSSIALGLLEWLAFWGCWWSILDKQKRLPAFNFDKGR
jgi:hypothetical protein